jgi:ketosteroid isomerase-like protein
MTETSDTSAVMDKYLDALRTGGDYARFFAPDVVWTTMETGERVEGRDAVRDYIAALHTQLFDAHPQLVRLVTGDGVAMLEAVFVGRHVGAWGDVPATGRDVRLPYAMSYDIAGGRITTLYAYFPIAALHAQLTRTELSESAPN